MSDRREQLAGRVRGLLVELEALAEGKVNAQQFEAQGPTHGSKDADGPQGQQATADYFVGRLERWCHDAERRMEDEQKGTADVKGQLPELNMTQLAFWVVASYEGVDYRVVAEHEGLATATVMRIRRNAGLEERKGLQKPDTQAA